MELYTMNSKNSAWTIGCSQHGYTWTPYFDSNRERVPATTGPKISDALHSFVFNGERVIAME